MRYTIHRADLDHFSSRPPETLTAAYVREHVTPNRRHNFARVTDRVVVRGDVGYFVFADELRERGIRKRLHVWKGKFRLRGKLASSQQFS